MIENNELIAVGKFQKTHALKGELNCVSDIDCAFWSEGNALVLEIEGIFVPFYAETVRPKGSESFLVKLSGIDSEEDARGFVNKTVYALKQQLAEFMDLDEDELKEEGDLVGYDVVDEETANVIGTLERVDSSTQNLLFIIKSPDGEEVFVPAVDEFIREVDDSGKRIIVSLPEGLIDINRKNN